MPGLTLDSDELSADAAVVLLDPRVVVDSEESILLVVEVVVEVVVSLDVPLWTAADEEAVIPLETLAWLIISVEELTALVPEDVAWLES